jgi:large subunit ribosomal protein L25
MSTAMSEVRIAAEPRTEFGKGGARRTRRAGKVPAVLYGHGQAPRHIALPAHDLMHAFKTDAGTNVLLTLELSGGGTELALPKDVQRHPIRGSFEHVDLVLVRRGEKVTVDVAVVLVGIADQDAIVDQQSMTVSVVSDASKIPNTVEVSIAGLLPGSAIIASQLELPEGTELDSEPDHVIVQLLNKRTVSQMEADLGEGGETASEGEAAPATAGATA